MSTNKIYQEELKILNKGLIRSEHHLDSLLNKIPKSARKDYINSKLGITGGEVSPGVGGYYSDEWFHGPQRDEAASSVITRSKHLTPEIIEHIKKYGNFNEKYNLFRNDIIYYVYCPIFKIEVITTLIL